MTIAELLSEDAKASLQVDKIKLGISRYKRKEWLDYHIHDDSGKPVPFHRGQVLGWDSTQRTVAIVSGSQSGKTSFGPWLMAREIERMGSGDYLAVTASYDLFKLKMLPSMLQVFIDILGIGKYWAGDRILEICDPQTGTFKADRAMDSMYARIILRSADALGGLESSTAKAAWLDECLAPEAIIETEIGVLSIDKIVNNKMPIRVWSYDIYSNLWELQPIIRWVKIPQHANLIQVGLNRITPEHKIWTKELGYIKSSDIYSSNYSLLTYNKIVPGCNTYVSSNSVKFNSNINILSEDGYVYNIEVAKNHNYVAGGILVANCGQDRFTYSAYKAIRRRLSLHTGRIFMTTTLYNMGWLINHIIDPAIIDGATQYEIIGHGELDYTHCPKKSIDLIQFDSIVNPIFPEKEYQEAKDSLSDEEFNMYYKGRKARMRDLIYDVFDSNKHVIKPFPIPPHWKKYMGVDFGSVHMAAVFFAEDPDTNILYAHKEYLAGNRTIKEHIFAMLAGESTPPMAYGGGQSEEQWRVEFGQNGLIIHRPSVMGDVNLGISRVYTQFKKDGIIIFNNLHMLLDELGRYRRKKDKSGVTTDEIEFKDTFHNCDSLRYLISTIRPGVPLLAKIVSLAE